jgi:hypothetical protein
VGELVVEVPDPAPAEGAAFAAGVAAATAAVAAEDAEQAGAAAETALRVSEGAAEAAYDARAEVESLRGELLARLDDVESRASMAAAVAVEAVESVETAAVDDMAPEETVPADPEPDRSADQPKDDAGSAKKRFGSDRWFGDRD